MQLDKLLVAIVGSVPENGRAAAYRKLSVMLNKKHGAGSISHKGIEKWFERGSISGPWLMKLAALPNKPLNLSDFA